MAYRGEDLDLRTPQGWAPPGREAQAGNEPNWWTRTTVYKGGRADPIWIDDAVMACCNHAYDLAVANRAMEVRLEHFINAMTQNEQIAKVLESRGIGVASLRRESGGIIAAEIPAGPAGGKVQPKRSEALEEMLRLAADHAYPRRTPVTIDDVLVVLFDLKRDLPGVQLLQRHAAPWAGRNGAEPRPELRQELRPELRLEPLPHLAPRPYAPEPRYASPAAHDYFTQPAAVPYQPQQYREAPPPAAPPMRSPREREPSSTTVDTVQNTRIEALERAVRDLGLDLTEDRKSLQGIVGDLQRQTAAQGDDTQRFRGSLTDRLNSLEDTFHRVRSEPTQVPTLVLDRIAGVERALDNRIAELGRGWSLIADRLQSIEQAMQRPVEQSLSPLLQARLETVSGLERKLEGLERTFTLILDRMTGLERQLAAPRPPQPVDLTPLQVRIGDLERSLIAKMPPTVDMTPVEHLSTQLTSGMGDLEQRIGLKVQQSVDLSPVTELLSGIESRVAGLERSIENRTAETGRTVSFIGERLRAFEETINTQKSQSTDRLGQIERSLSAYAERTVETTTAHERDLGELHEALVKLNANQQTLANSLEQWRLDNTGDLSVVNNRLKAIEETSARRAPLVETLGAQVAAIHAAVAKREVNNSRFKQWLYGTQEWYSASYDTERWRARQVADTVNGGSAPRPAPRPAPAAPPPSAPTIRRQ